MLLRRFAGPLGGCLVHAALGDRGQQLVGLLFLGERFVEQFDGVLETEQLRPCSQGAVPGNLIVLGGLAGCDETGIADGLGVDLVDHFLTFGDDAEYRIALPALRLLVDQLEDPFEPADLAFGLAAVVDEGLGELLVRAVLRELRKGFEQLLLGIVVSRIDEASSGGREIGSPFARNSPAKWIGVREGSFQEPRRAFAVVATHRW
jgi:hypothetical protein